MSPFATLFTDVAAWLVLLSHVFSVVLIISLFTYRRFQFAEKFVRVIGSNAFVVISVIAVGSSLASLVYSDVIGFLPCTLCWIQRGFLYPQVLLLALWGWNSLQKIENYILALSLSGGAVALYHSYTQMGGLSLTSCTGEGGDCSIVYFMKFGYISMPMMAFTAFLLISLVVLAYKRSR